MTAGGRQGASPTAPRAGAGPAQAAPSIPPGGLVAVLGCSNTVQHAQGYTDASTVDALVFGDDIC